MSTVSDKDSLAVTLEELLARYYNRDSEVALIEQMLDTPDDAQGEQRGKRMINFVGISGSGKSWLLRWLYHKYQQAQIPCLFLNGKAIAASPEVSKEHFLQQFINSVSDEFEPAILPHHVDNQETVQQLEDSLGTLLKEIDSRQTNIILFIDDYDRFPSHLTEVFEGSVLANAIKHERVLAVLTSRSALMYQLRLHTYSHNLEMFTHETVSDKYQEYVDLVEHILQITAGLPTCVEGLFDQLRQRQISTGSEFLTHEKEFVRINYEWVSERVLVNIAPDKMRELCILSIPRRFNAEIMGRLLPEVMPGKYGDCTSIDYLNLAEDLGHPTVWIMARIGYTILEPVRRILSYYMASLDADRFSAINDTLLEIYEPKIHPPPFKVHDPVEYLYHKLVSIRLANGEETLPEVIGQELSEHIQAVFRQWLDHDASLDDLNSLKKMLETDPDIQDYISEDTQNFMEQAVRS